MHDDLNHFSQVAEGRATQDGRYVDVSAIPAMEMLPGLNFQPVAGVSALVNFVSFEPHTEAPLHTHEEEQIVIVLDGEFDFTIDGDTRTMRPGDVAVIPPWVPHGAITGDSACREMDVFTPPRSTLVEYATAQIDASRRKG